MMGKEDPEVIQQMTMWSIVLDMGTTVLQATSAINMSSIVWALGECFSFAFYDDNSCLLQM